MTNLSTLATFYKVLFSMFCIHPLRHSDGGDAATPCARPLLRVSLIGYIETFLRGLFELLLNSEEDSPHSLATLLHEPVQLLVNGNISQSQQQLKCI